MRIIIKGVGAVAAEQLIGKLAAGDEVIAEPAVDSVGAGFGRAVIAIDGVVAGAPSIVSLPASPYSVSSPASPKMVSLPILPWTRSGPARAEM